MDSDFDLSPSTIQNRKRAKRCLSLKRAEEKRRRSYQREFELKRKRQLATLFSSSEAETSSSTSTSSSPSTPVCGSSNFDSHEVHSDTVSENENISYVCQSSSSESSIGIVSNRSPGTLWDDLRNVALDTSMTETQINSLLKVLRQHQVGPLPLDSRILKKSTDNFSHLCNK